MRKSTFNSLKLGDIVYISPKSPNHGIVIEIKDMLSPCDTIYRDILVKWPDIGLSIYYNLYKSHKFLYKSRRKNVLNKSHGKSK
jgi:hypothetical protein